MNDTEIAWRVFGVITIIVLLAGSVILWSKRPVVNSTLTPLPSHPKCIICNNHEATEYWPIIKRSWLDQDMTGHRKLHGQAPMFTVTSNQVGTPDLCPSHRRLIERQWEQILTEIRLRRAKLELGIETTISSWENGEMLSWVRSNSKITGSPESGS